MRYKVRSPMRYGRKSYAAGESFTAEPSAVLDSFRRAGFIEIVKEATTAKTRTAKVKGRR